MAHTLTQVVNNTGVAMVTWATLGDAETGGAANTDGRSDYTITASGTWGAATVTMEGSNDNSNWFPMTDFLGVAMTFTANGMKTVGTSPFYVRARTSGGTGTDVTVILAGKPRM